MQDRRLHVIRIANARLRITSIEIILLLLGILATGSGRAEQLVRELEYPGFLARVVTIPRDGFTVEQIEAVARRFLIRERDRPGIIGLMIYPDNSETTANCKCVTDVTYELWWALYQDYVRDVRPVAELLSINGNASLQVRDLRGRIDRKVVAGNDPLDVLVPACRARILFAAPSFGSGRRGPWPHFTFYLRSATVSTLCAEQVRDKVIQLLGSDDVTTRVRQDAWFIESEEFPVAYSFDEDVGPPPSKEAYLKSPEAWCTLINGVVRCSAR